MGIVGSGKPVMPQPWGHLKLFVPETAESVDKGAVSDPLFETTVIKQNPKTHYCGLLSAMDALLHHPNVWVRQWLPRMVRQVAKQTYAVHFPGCRKPVRVPLKDLKPTMVYQSYTTKYGQDSRAIPVPLLNEGPLGSRIILCAFAKHRQQAEEFKQKQFHHRMRCNPEEALAILTGGSPFWRNPQGTIRLCRNSLPGETSFAQEIRAKPFSEKVQAYRRQLYSELNQYGLQPHRYALVATTPGDDSDLQRPVNPHANAIRRIDVNTQTVTVTDPLDTSKPIVLSYDDFLERYNGFGGVDLSTVAAAKMSV